MGNASKGLCGGMNFTSDQKFKKSLRKLLKLLVDLVYSFILSQECNKHLLCTNFYSCDLSYRSISNIKQTCPSSKMLLQHQEPRSFMSCACHLLFLSNILTVSLCSFNLRSCLPVPGTWPWIQCESKTPCLLSQNSQFSEGDKTNSPERTWFFHLVQQQVVEKRDWG